jgi:hypothetical protein
VLVDLRTYLTAPALAALFGTSQSTVDRVIHHLMPLLPRNKHDTASQGDHRAICILEWAPHKATGLSGGSSVGRWRVDALGLHRGGRWFRFFFVV